MLLQALTKIFEDEVEKKVNEKLNKYIEHVSKTYVKLMSKAAYAVLAEV